MVKVADPEQAPLTSDAAEQAGNDTQALLGAPNQRDSYGPLPYPSNYANYINLTALVRDTAESRVSSLPWWDLPNAGRWYDLTTIVPGPTIVWESKIMQGFGIF
ncbi:hypothetical protein WJX77_005936 [Trebouxia sp. C0004]